MFSYKKSTPENYFSLAYEKSYYFGIPVSYHIAKVLYNLVQKCLNFIEILPMTVDTN